VSVPTAHEHDVGADMPGRIIYLCTVVRPLYQGSDAAVRDSTREGRLGRHHSRVGIVILSGVVSINGSGIGGSTWQLAIQAKLEETLQSARLRDLPSVNAVLSSATASQLLRTLRPRGVHRRRPCGT
jgi:hypothetical protein